METFLSTLAQTMAALIAILLAAVAAYYIFLQSKFAEYDDKIQAEQTGIRTDIAGLQAQWPEALAMLLPPEFKEHFSARVGNLHGARLLEKLAVAVLFGGPEVTSALADVRSLDSFGSEHWKGRVYFLALDEAQKVVSGGASLAPAGFALTQAEPGAGDWEFKPQPAAAFPWSPVGPGFQQWRDDFDLVSGFDHFMGPYDDAWVSDFRAFLDSHPGPMSDLRLRLYINAVRSFHRSVASMRGHVRAIDALELSQSRYRFQRRVNRTALVVLVILASITGAVAPMFLMAGEFTMTPWAASAVLTASLVLMVAAFVQFGRDILRPFSGDPKLYVSDRWMRPILEDLERCPGLIQSASTVPVERVTEYLLSGPTRDVPSELVAGLKQFQASAAAYDKSAEALDTTILDALRGHAQLRPFVKPWADVQNRRQYSVMHPGDVIGPGGIEQLRKGTRDAGEIFFAVETPTHWGSRGRLALAASATETGAFWEAMESLAQAANSSAETKDYREKREGLLRSVAELKAQLERFLRAPVPSAPPSD